MQMKLVALNSILGNNGLLYECLHLMTEREIIKYYNFPSILSELQDTLQDVFNWMDLILYSESAFLSSICTCKDWGSNY